MYQLWSDMIHDSYQHVRQFNQFYIMIEYTLDSESNFLETSDRKIAIDQSPLSPYLSDNRELVPQGSFSTMLSSKSNRWITNDSPLAFSLQQWPRSLHLQHHINKFSPNYCHYYLTWSTHTVCAKNLVNIRPKISSSNNQRAFENNICKLEHKRKHNISSLL